jgi:tetratricopeptide (TPR) repeat protein
VIDNRPGIGNRPNIDIGTLPNIGNAANVIGSGNNVNVNRPVNVSQNVNNHNRPTTLPAYGWKNGYWHGYYQGAHGNWNNGYWSSWAHHPAAWVGSAALAGWLFSPGDTFVYSNPYVVESTTVAAPALDYTQPIPVPTYVESQPPVEQSTAPYGEPPSPAGDEPSAASKVPPEATEAFEEARASFKKSDYQGALRAIEKALTLLPGDATLHEFRALVLFAQKKYSEAAGAIYAVLAVGPGWDWDTLASLYPDTETYTKQLRALEKFQRDNPKNGDAHFLLAYHYLILDRKEAAVKQLEQVVKLVPGDKLSAQLLTALTQTDSKKPEVQPY